MFLFACGVSKVLFTDCKFCKNLIKFYLQPLTFGGDEVYKIICQHLRSHNFQGIIKIISWWNKPSGLFHHGTDFMNGVHKNDCVNGDTFL